MVNATARLLNRWKNDPVPTVQEAVWVPELAWKGA
jgi:hypothetical protein